MMVFALLLLLAALAGIGVWAKFHGWFRHGNGREYSPSRLEPDPESPLAGKTIFCLGSSVTGGLSSCGISFVDYIARLGGCTMIKEAVSASTLADISSRSYLRRLRRHPAVKRPIDCFLCQLSTNDATFYSALGRVSESFDPNDFDTKTSVGGMEAIIAFVRETWGCPIVFFTGTRYDNPRYHKLVNQLLRLEEKWGITVIDRWHDEAMDRLTQEERRLYMNDDVHPTMAGYLLWWTPVIQRKLYDVFQSV